MTYTYTYTLAFDQVNSATLIVFLIVFLLWYDNVILRAKW